MKALKILLLISLIFEPNSCEHHNQCTKLFFTSQYNQTIPEFIRIEIINNEQNEIFPKIENFLEKSKENFQTFLHDEYNFSLPLIDANIISCFEYSNISNQNSTDNILVILNMRFDPVNINSSELNFNSILLESILINQNLIQRKLKITYRQILNELTEIHYSRKTDIPSWIYTIIGLFGLLFIASFIFFILKRTQYKNKYYVTKKNTELNKKSNDNFELATITIRSLDNHTDGLKNTCSQSSDEQISVKPSYSSSRTSSIKKSEEDTQTLYSRETVVDFNKTNVYSSSIHSAEQARLARMLKKTLIQ